MPGGFLVLLVDEPPLRWNQTITGVSSIDFECHSLNPFLKWSSIYEENWMGCSRAAGFVHSCRYFVHVNVLKGWQLILRGGAVESAAFGWPASEVSGS